MYAYKAELDAWWHNQNAAVGSSEAGASNPPAIQDEPAPPLVTTKKRPSVGSLIRRVPLLGRFAILALLLVIAGLVVWRVEQARLPRNIASFFLSGNNVIAIAADGSTDWSYSYAHVPKHLVQSSILPEGFCGNHGADALILVEFEDRTNDNLGCFNQTGILVWQFQLDESYLCQGSGFGPPWHVDTWKTFRVGDETRLAVALHHDKWWPGVIVTLDSKGRVLQRFLNAGWITDLRVAENANGRFLVAGGITNSQDAAMLAILDLNSLGGSSPEQPVSQYDCTSSFAGHPLKYYVFPRTELNKVTGAERNFTELDDVGRSLFARTRENQSSGHFNAAEALYGFSDTFELTSATFGDRYWDFHQELEKAGVLKHSKNQCPDRFGPRLVRMWDPEHGWRDLHPH